MDGVKIMLIMTCLVMLSVVSAAPPGLADSQSSDIGSLFDQDDSPASQLHEAKLNDDEYNNFLRDLLRRRGSAVASFNLPSPDQAVSPNDYHIKSMTWKLCLPGTDCDFGDLADEADAKEILRPGADTNPGRRRRRSTDQMTR